MILDMSSTCMT